MNRRARGEGATRLRPSMEERRLRGEGMSREELNDVEAGKVTPGEAVAFFGVVDDSAGGGGEDGRASMNEVGVISSGELVVAGTGESWDFDVDANASGEADVIRILPERLDCD